MPDKDARFPVDPDVDLHVAAMRDETRSHGWDIGLAIAAGGAVGAVMRYGLSLAVPSPVEGFPWATFTTNVSGCLLIGVLMVILTDVSSRAHRLVRPFLGVGILGGFTTFSTYTVETQQLIVGDAPGVGFGYLFGTLAAALAAVQVAMTITRAIAGARRARGRP